MGGATGSPMDVSALTAIDVHVHVHASVGAPADRHERLEGMSDYFRAGKVSQYTVPEIAEYYRSRRMGAVVFGVDTLADGDAPGRPSNEEVAELAAEHRDVLIPFASVDPARGADAVARARRLVDGRGIRGFKFHPNLQGFFPNDREVYPLYEVLQEHGMVALFHSGHTGVGAGSRGGQGCG
ncbi:amidohydrolase family protein [Blastococcus brunescens]|uniref:Amidohydrolase family protein n=1 Tax=Blastococcus brunescens TaxID=1564165 RepID=A0ABZ1B8J5_9ACTN|nr:amidohydrolase family protein [Blastococcus sp. BMG 8361]WRL67125.1 amidohydrolase family protein [Blastococcus sp. BMG 8361]